MKQLRSLPVHTYDLNYLVEDSDIQFDQKISPLLSACYVGKLEIVMIMLDNDCINIDMESFPECYTPLMVACFKGFYEIVRLLLDRKANVNKLNRLGQKPILFCFSRLEEMYYKYENKKICMMLLDLLLSKGADINVKIDEKLGYTILMKLASIEIDRREKLYNTLDIIKFLIERGADSSIRSYNNKSVFDVIHPKTEESFKEELINTIKNTKHSIFYNCDDNNNNISVNTQNLNSSANAYIKRPSLRNNHFLNDKNCVIIQETNEVRLNCCILCKIF